MSIFNESIVYDKKNNDIRDMINNTEINFIANAGTVSKQGNRAYRNFLRSLKDRLYREDNPVQQSTVWDKIKRLEARKNGV